MPRVPLEKDDRTKLKSVLVDAGCKYVNVKFGGPFSGTTGQPDLFGAALDGKFFGIELKRRDRDPWTSCTTKQQSKLEKIQESGGRGCAARFLNRDLVEVWIPLNGRMNSFSITVQMFVKMILTGEGWPQWN